MVDRDDKIDRGRGRWRGLRRRCVSFPWLTVVDDISRHVLVSEVSAIAKEPAFANTTPLECLVIESSLGAFPVGWSGAVPRWHDKEGTFTSTSSRIGVSMGRTLDLERRTLMPDSVPTL